MIKAFDSTRKAISEAEERPNKAIFRTWSKALAFYAIVDIDDLKKPERCEEISLKELYNDV